MRSFSRRPQRDVQTPGCVGWMFPHHQHDIAGMLDDGIRALALDIHYGIQGADRVKTDFEREGVSQEKIEEAIGPEGTAAALRDPGPDRGG